MRHIPHQHAHNLIKTSVAEIYRLCESLHETVVYFLCKELYNVMRAVPQKYRYHLLCGG